MARRAMKTSHPANVCAGLIVTLHAIFGFGLKGMQRREMAR
jgi:hypothetical protein